MAHMKHTFCRICEPLCPIIARFDDGGQITELRPNPEHPSGGLACHKGLSILEIHNDPDRVNWPQRRLNPRTQARGDFAESGWDDAIADIGTRISRLPDSYGPNVLRFILAIPVRSMPLLLRLSRSSRTASKPKCALAQTLRMRPVSLSLMGDR
jgi:anaerobic selenocysteine-containing dehydrogenase